MAGMGLRGTTQGQPAVACQAVPLRTPTPCPAGYPLGRSTEANLALTRLCSVMWALPSQNPSNQGVWEGAGVYEGGEGDGLKYWRLERDSQILAVLRPAGRATTRTSLWAPSGPPCLRFSSFCCKTG